MDTFEVATPAPYTPGPPGSGFIPVPVTPGPPPVRYRPAPDERDVPVPVTPGPPPVLYKPRPRPREPDFIPVPITPGPPAIPYKPGPPKSDVIVAPITPGPPPTRYRPEPKEPDMIVAPITPGPLPVPYVSRPAGLEILSLSPSSDPVEVSKMRPLSITSSPIGIDLGLLRGTISSTVVSRETTLPMGWSREMGLAWQEIKEGGDIDTAEHIKEELKIAGISESRTVVALRRLQRVKAIRSVVEEGEMVFVITGT